jgi:phosphohistidine phosphatase
MSNALGDAEAVVDEELYGADGNELLERLRAVDDRFETVAVIGHNPGIHDLAIALAGSGAELHRMEAKFPTGALAVLAFDGRWRDVSPGGGLLEAFVTPRDLG